MERLQWKYRYACALKPRFGGSEAELFDLADLAWHHLRHLDPAAVATLELRRPRRRSRSPPVQAPTDAADLVVTASPAWRL